MKCGSCYTDNVNEAVYCSSCGANLRKMRLNEKHGNISVFVMVIACVGLLIAALIVCSRRINAVTASRAVNGSQFVLQESSFFAYSSSNGKKLVCVSVKEKEGEKREEKKLSSKITNIVNGKDCAVVEAGGKVYFAANGVFTELNDCRSYSLSEGSAVCAFINSKSELYKCTADGKKPRLASVDVLEFDLNAKGDLYYLRNDISPSDDRKPLDKNGFYMDSRYLCAEEPGDRCKGIVCTNSFGIYFVTESRKLYAVTPSADGDNKYMVEDFASLVLAGDMSILFTRSDGYTYLWHSNLEDEVYAEAILSKPIIPSGYRFTGDDYTNLLFEAQGTEYGTAVAFINKDQKCSILDCENMNSFVTAGNCSIFYCKDNEGRLWRYDSYMKHEPKVCAENVDIFCPSAEGKTVYYMTGDMLCSYDGYNVTEIAEISGVTSLTVSEHDILIAEAESKEKYSSGGAQKTRTVCSLYLYKSGTDTEEVPVDAKGIEYIGYNGFGFCYIDKTDVHILTPDGEFMTANDLMQEKTDEQKSEG